ncbi:MAG: hypothetical protein ACREAC_19780, partial [Blastocatellia bacterium]
MPLRTVIRKLFESERFFLRSIFDKRSRKAAAKVSPSSSPLDRRHSTGRSSARSTRITGRGLVRGLTRRSPERKVACFVIAASLLMWPLPNIFANVVKVVASTVSSEATHLSDGGAARISLILKDLFRKKARQDTAADRVAHISSIEISPRKFLAYVGQMIPFNSLSTDSLGRTVQGIRFAYSSSDTSKITITDQGVATCLAPGLSWITASA